jgi:hypothetical protein
MLMPWSAQDAEDIVTYFEHILVPKNSELRVNEQLDPIQVLTSRTAVETDRQHLAAQEAIDADQIEQAKQANVLTPHVEAMGGIERVKRVLEFSKFCSPILERLGRTCALYRPFRITKRRSRDLDHGFRGSQAFN